MTQTTGTITAIRASETEFVVTFDGVLPGTPEQAWFAVTTSAATAGWIWPMEEFEPRVGGRVIGETEDSGTRVTAWDHPSHFGAGVEGEHGWYNFLDYHLQPTADGQTTLHYVHRGVAAEHFKVILDGCAQHTALYNHSLGQYLAHFNGQSATCLLLDAPAASATPDGLTRIKAALGLTDASAAGDRVQFEVPGVGTIDAEVDYLAENFVGLRAQDAMYRFYGRNAFGGPVGLSEHHFATDAAEHEQGWTDWLQSVYGESQ